MGPSLLNPPLPFRCCALLICLARFLANSVSAQQLAFEGAEGFGAYATGARTNLGAATIYHVTNLNDSGAGSFRDAVSGSNRFVVFDVGGIINIESVVSVKSNITIAGQTAPGGISIYGDKVSFTDANQLIARHFAVRKGNAGVRNDSASIARGDSMIFDHMSVTWGVDETFSMNPDSGATIDNITIQNSIIAQGLDRLGHSAGGLMTLGEGSSFSVIASLLADNVTRNPKVRGENEFINNVIYAYETAGYIMGDTTSMDSHANVIGNYFIEGPVNGSSPFASGTANFHIYGSDNWVDANRDGVLNGSLNTTYPGADVVSTPFAFPTAATMTAQQAVAFVMENAGLSIIRDAVDTRLMQEVASYGTIGGVILRETDLFPGYGTDPIYVNVRARLIDTDNDAMPDNWETARGLNPANATDWKGIGADGYTRLEQYLNEIGGTRADTVWAAGGGTWQTSASWSSGTPSLAGEALIVGNGAGTNGQVTIATGAAFVRRLSIGGNGAAAGERVTVSGGTLDVFDTIHAGAANHGILAISGGTVSAGQVLLGGQSGATLYTGTLSLTGGILQTGRILSDAGSAMLDWNGGTIRAIAEPDISVPATLGILGGLIDTNGFSGTFSGSASGAGGLTKLGAGTLAVSGANTFNGSATIKAGVVSVFTLANGGSPSPLGQSSSAAANLVLDGGTLQHTGALGAFTDRLFTLTANGGTLDGSGSGADPGTGLSFFGTGNVVLTAGGDRTLTLTGSAPTGNASSRFTLQLSDPSGSKTSLVKSGPGRWFIGGATKTYSGDTTISAGTLQYEAHDVLPYGFDRGNVTITTGASLGLGAFNARINGLNGGGSVNQTGTNTRALTLGHGDASGNFAGNINASVNFSVNKVGAGTQVFSGTNTFGNGASLTGGAFISGGVLQFNSAASMGGGTVANFTVQSGAAIAAGYALDQTFISRINTSSAGTVALAVNSAAALNFNSTSLASVSLGSVGNTSYTGALTPFATTYRLGGGNGTLTLPNANALTGTRDLLVTGAGSAIALPTTNDYSGTTTVAVGSTLIASTIADGSAASSIGTSDTAAANLVLDGGTLKHTGGNSFTNRLFMVTANGGALDGSGGGLSFYNTDAVALSGSGDRTLTLTGTASTSAVSSHFALALGNPTGGKTSLVKDGVGRWFIGGGAKTYTGETTILQGTLQFETTAGSALPFGAGKGNVTVGSGATLNLGNNSTSLNGLNGGGTLTQGGTQTRSLTLGNGDASGNFSGTISGASVFSVNKIGTGTQILGGIGSYGGATSVSAGTLLLEGSFASTNAVNTSATGEVQLGASDRLNDSAALRMGGGTFDTAGFSEKIGALSLSSGVVSTIDLGQGASRFQLADSSGQAWIGSLRIINWSGSTSGAGIDQMFFGSSATGLTSLQLASVQFIDPAGAVGTYGAQMLSTGEIVAVVPEPSTALLMCGGAAGLFGIRRFRWSIPKQG
jgi:autotransporter-associated beta strand protein